MIKRSDIGWTDYSGGAANFVLRGKLRGDCECSPGCAHCYAWGLRNRDPQRAADVTTYSADKLRALARWVPRESGQPYRRGPGSRPLVFVCDMGDLFHERITDSFILQAVGVLASNQRVDWQILTKRSARMAQLLAPMGELPANLWLGVTCEDQRRVDERLPDLARVRAAVRYVSCEPLLEAVTLPRGIVDWVIVGGESGDQRRPFDTTWAAALRDWCTAEGVAMFYKQGATRWPGRDCLLGGHEVKQWPAVDAPPTNLFDLAAA